MKTLSKQFVLNYQKVTLELFGWTIYLGLSIYSALNIASIRYGSPDDLSIASMQFGQTGILENSIESAKQTGRIQQIPFYISILKRIRERRILHGRGREIRTPDPLVPNQMRYRTALCPEIQ